VIADFARKYDVPYQRLHGRFYGTPAKSDLIPGNRRFLDIEEKAICRYLDRLDKLGLPAQRELLRGAADYILLANWTPASTDEKPPSVGQHWVRRFLKRHPEYTLKRQKVLDLERKRAESYENLQNWFQLLQSVIASFGIDSDDIWNFDETGFRIGVGRDQLVISNPEFTEVLDKFIRGSVLQSTELLQSATLAEHDLPNKCEVSAPCTIDGLYSLGEFLQWRMDVI
jgi:hypothetical protein